MDSGPVRRSLRPAHVVAGCIALGLIAMTGFHLAQQVEPVPRAVDATPWIGLPRSGMDASEPEVRMLVQRGLRFSTSSSDIDSLAFQCGSFFREPTFGERYIAHIGESTWGPSWRIVMDIRGEDIHFSWSEGELISHPPPPPEMVDGLTLVSTVSTLTKPRAEVDNIRERWRDPDLWDAPQDRQSFSCFDGNPVFLEACVDGRYAARARNCNAVTFEATDKLWRAFNELLPAPPKSEWRDSKGNKVEPDSAPVPHYGSPPGRAEARR